MNLERQIKQSLQKAIDKAGTQMRLEALTGVKQPSINRLLSGKRPAGGITVNTLKKLFPELEITFFQDDLTAKTQSLPPIIRKIVDIVNELDEDSQLDLLTDIVRLIEQHKINRRK